jgi:hypothetical protein
VLRLHNESFGRPELNNSFASASLVARSVLVCDRSFHRQFTMTVVSATPSGSLRRFPSSYRSPRLFVAIRHPAHHVRVTAVFQHYSLLKITASSTCISALCCGSQNLLPRQSLTNLSILHFSPFCCSLPSFFLDSAFPVALSLHSSLSYRLSGWSPHHNCTTLLD